VTESFFLQLGNIISNLKRNPAFQEDGKGITAWNKDRAALKKQSLMQKCTYQEVVGCLGKHESLNWLKYELAEKYGFCARSCCPAD
jgi:hypothetical protein